MKIEPHPCIEVSQRAVRAHYAGNLELSAELWREALRLNKTYVPAYVGLGNVYQVMRRFELAENCFLAALEFTDHPNVINYSYRQLAFAFREMGKHHQAVLAMKEAIGNNLTHNTAYEMTGLLPPIYESREEIDKTFTQMLDMMNNIPQTPGEFAPMWTHFYLAYMGRNDDRLIHEAAYKSLRPFFPEMIGHRFKKRKKKKKRKPGPVKIGLVSTYFHEHSVAKCFMNLFKELNSDPDIQVYCLCAPGCGRDTYSDFIKENSYRQIYLTDQDKLKKINSLELDVLGYTDIGMDVATYKMAFTRLAPIQLVFAGHPVTTGMDTIDYFISSKLLNRKEHQSLFTEELVLLDGLITDYERPAFELLPREQVEMPEGTVYTCPMTIFKVHPDFDETIEAILNFDPEAKILFFKFGNTTMHHKLVNRLAQSLSPENLTKVFFRSWAGTNEFMSVLHYSKAILDTPYFGAGNTSYAAMSSLTPIITLWGWKNDSAKNANTQAHYKIMGDEYYEKYVANSPYEYAKKAVAVDGKLDPDAVNTLFNRNDGTQAFKKWIKEKVLCQ